MKPECCCCFEDKLVVGAIVKATKCERGHVVCFACLQKTVEIAVGDQKIVKCMDQSLCTAGYSDRSFRTAIKDKRLLRAYDNVVAEITLKAANINNLYTCPFCHNAAIVEIPISEQRYFSCLGCNKRSCRSCKKDEHEGPCNPEQHSKDEEETANFVLKCCGSPFVRGDGCNKVTCPNCRKIYCWICKKRISGYHHFDQRNYGGRKGNCKLWGDPVPPKPQPTPAQAADLARLAELETIERPVIPRAPRLLARRRRRGRPLPRPPRPICAGVKANGQPCTYVSNGRSPYCNVHGRIHQRQQQQIERLQAGRQQIERLQAEQQVQAEREFIVVEQAGREVIVVE
jgi:hypothetical protein